MPTSTVNKKWGFLALFVIVVVQVVLQTHMFTNGNVCHSQWQECKCSAMPASDSQVTKHPNNEASDLTNTGTTTSWDIKNVAQHPNIVGVDLTDTGTDPENLVTGPKSAATGQTFSGKQVRNFPAEQFKFAFFDSSKQNHKITTMEPSCERWGVMTTIFKPSETLRRWVRVEGWCLVIVGDRKTPQKYKTGWTHGEGNDAVIYLSPEDQEALNLKFVDALPWNNFGRKNVGYLYAIMHGASVIWDFDDDNMLKYWIPGAAPKGAPSLYAPIVGEGVNTIQALELRNHSFPTYNPYPTLGAPTLLPSWPRGLPLSHIKFPECHSTPTVPRDINHQSIAVLQSLADHQPDVDAIYRITMPIPFSFRRSSNTRPLLVPRGVLTPYNAQATLHFQVGFWALLLPITVHGRVSDIWRSYFAQRLFWDVGLQAGFFARPLVVQKRNPHSNLGDLDAERDLYQKSEQLVEFLGRWKGKGKTLVERTEELWVTLYEHQYIEMNDVLLLQQWLQALLDVGYSFPELRTTSPLRVYQLLNSEQKLDKDDDTCDTNLTTPLTFWTSDLHDGTRIDIPSALVGMGHKVILAGFKQRFTPYPFVLKRNGFSVYERLSNVLEQFKRHSTALTEKMIKDNYDFYKDDKHIASTDAFMCMFPASMCELWMPFNKTLILMPAHRYNLGRCTKEQWDRLDEHLNSLISMNSPKHVISAESFYDQEYLRHYTGIDPLPLFSFSGFYTENNAYAPKRPEILVFGTWDDRLRTKISKFKIRDVHSIYRHYQLSDLVKHRAVVYMPYAVMSYKLTEVYSLNIPLFMPSMRYFRNVKRTIWHDRSSLGFWFCANQSLNNLMKPHPSSIHPYSPNVDVPEDPEAEFYWLQLADFFYWPHITHFDDFNDLERKLESANFDRIHNLMVQENKCRREELLHNLCKVTKMIQPGRTVPQDYSSGIQQLYGAAELQVT